MSHPNPAPPKANVQLDLNEADTITCKECGNASFIESYFLKRISALVSPTGKEAIVPIQVFACGNCGSIPQKMIEGSGLEK
jgi:Zn finger protein HypA/HybF involved in hydrogenase expression